jgi:hypothetical protein
VKDEDLARLWSELAGEDVLRARGALWTLVASRDQAVSFLQARLKPTPPVEAKQVQRWISDLDSEDFATREKATHELNELGELAEPAMKRVLEKQPTLEARRRINSVLDRIHSGITSSDMMRSLRAVEVLERIGTEEAQNALKVLAKGVPEARLTQEATSAVDRLKRH